METNSLYIHIPFCETICRYCDFCKVYYDKKQASLYLEILFKELESLSIKRPLKTIYIGGGTPSALTDEQLENLMAHLKPYIDQNEEFCIEVNPESMDYYKLQILKRGGINRLSIGVQTFQDHLLKEIDRHHTKDQVLRIIRQAQMIGFSNISIDLMYGLPYQNREDIKRDLEIVRTLNIQHISYYALILENNTILKFQHFQPLDSEEEYQINCFIDRQLHEMGFLKYEISNYAKKGYESKHNLVYWHYDNYYGIGVGACSKIDDRIIEHSKSLTKYLNQTDQNHVIYQNKQETMFNHLMMSLRLKEGLNLKRFYALYQQDAYLLYKEAIEKNIKNNHLLIENGCLKTTDTGMYLLNDILLDFMKE
ncbi:MAG: radical SAM family heme chaperone HemW [Faecalibacillus sp.]